MRRYSLSVSSLIALLMLLAMLSIPVSAQEARGTITGRVIDASNAVVPNATVTVADPARGASVTLMTNAEGLFRAPYLVPGSYQITAEAAGFKKYVRSGVTLQMNETRDLEIALQVGGGSEVVSVVADIPALQTSEASMSQTVDTRRVAELPLVHGDPYTLMALSPGVTFARDPRLDRPFEPTHIVGFTMDGTRANRSDLTIDGVPSTARANGNEVISSYVPPTDIIQEFKVQTATFDAQFGNTEGGVTSIGIKSGTNVFHGTGYFWEEPGGLAANDWIANNRGQARPFTFSNRYGLTGNGPVMIPKLYNGRNKTFWTFGWEGIRDSRPRYDSTTPTVPTDAMKSGDFSAFLKLGTQYQIYNPFTRRVSTPGHYVEDPFVGNIIPSNLINPVTKGLLQYWGSPKAPFTPGTAFLGNNQDSSLAEKTLKYDTYTIRLDHSITPTQKIFGRASWYDRDSFYNNYFNSIATGTTFQFISRQGAFDYVNTINATTVLNLRYGYNRFIRVQDLPRAGWGFDLASVGFPSSYANAIPENIRRFPRIDFPGGTYQGTGQSGEFRPNDLHSILGTLNKSWGQHFLRGGVEFRSYRQNDIFTSNDETGRFTFDNTYTKQTDTATAPQEGLSFAAFLLGIPSAGSGSYVNTASSFAEQSVTWGLFAQDDWKLLPKLTLNLGLRYEFEQPMTERFNRSVSGFDSSYVQPIQAAVQAKYANAQTPEVPAANFKVLGGLQFPGMNGHPDGLYETPKGNFMPRIGLAYSLTPKTVIRAGYGIFYGFLGQRRSDVIQSGYSQQTAFIPTTNQLDSAGHVIFSATLSNPFPNGIVQPVGAAQGPQTFLGQNISFFNQHPKNPYMQRWQFGVQRELPFGLIAEAAYVGNRGTHVEISRNLNVTPQQYLSKSTVRDNTTRSYLIQTLANPFFGILPSTTGIGGSSTISRESLMRPFPEFGTVTTTTNDGYSWYHSGQFRLAKSMKWGLSAQLSYTWSKFMQATELLNQDDAVPTRVISDTDYPHRVSVNWLYEFPFGQGKAFLNNNGWLVSRVLFGGWQVQGVFTHQSGAPIPFTAQTGGYLYNGDLRKMELPKDLRSISQYFTNVASTTNTDPNAPGFITNSNLQLDHNVRTFPLRFAWVRADGIHNIDASLIKNTSINERMKVQLRFEAINAFNHPLFAAPSTTIGSSFGKITNTNQANYPRRIQMGAKFIF
jgi:hypothetical protein